MADIIERLRNWADLTEGGRAGTAGLMREAADEIERLRAALERVGPGKWNGCEDCEYSTRIAREALKDD